MTVTIKGLDMLKRRFQARGLARALRHTLRHEAEIIAADAARAAPGRLGETVEVIDESRGDKLSVAVGTGHRAGRFLEHGTVRQPATPWLWPALLARLPRIKQGLRKSLRASFETSRSTV